MLVFVSKSAIPNCSIGYFSRFYLKNLLFLVFVFKKTRSIVWPSKETIKCTRTKTWSNNSFSIWYFSGFEFEIWCTRYCVVSICFTELYVFLPLYHALMQIVSCSVSQRAKKTTILSPFRSTIYIYSLWFCVFFSSSFLLIKLLLAKYNIHLLTKSNSHLKSPHWPKTQFQKNNKRKRNSLRWWHTNRFFRVFWLRCDFFPSRCYWFI